MNNRRNNHNGGRGPHRGVGGRAGAAQLPVLRQRTPGTRLSFPDLLQNPPMPAALETNIPFIRRAETIADAAALELIHHNGDPDLVGELPPIAFFSHNGQTAYAPVRLIKQLGHHERGWGALYSGISYTRVEGEESTYRAPPPNQTLVAIKMLNKRRVDQYLRRRANATPRHDLRNVDADYLNQVINITGCENPYREILFLQELGDGVHVIQPIEILQDDENLYIILPHAQDQGNNQHVYSLDNFIYRRQEPMAPEDARHIFRQILNILAYLEENNIHHRDLSPDNFIFVGPGRIVATDFAMSVRIPEQDGQRTLIRGMGRFGTPAFMAPEISRNFDVFDGVAADLWSAMLILYSMCTGLPLYRQPDAAIDIAYRVFVVAEGVAGNVNELVREAWEDVFDPEEGDPAQQAILLQHARARLRITEDALDLFFNVFRVNPSERWTLGDVMDSRFVWNRQHRRV